MYVYILCNKTLSLYIGVTNDLVRRVDEHKQKQVSGFTKRYNINRLIYFEETSDQRSAIEREKELKGWKRNKKLYLIDSFNPMWKDLSRAWD